MKTKVAIVGFEDSQRTILSVALTRLSGYQLIQNRNHHEWLKLFHIDEKQKDKWDNQILYISSSFVERINSVLITPEFISNGATFSEVLYLKSKLNEGTVKMYEPQEIDVLDCLLHVACKHVALHYDMVMHIRNAFSAGFDEMSAAFYEKYLIPYKIYEGDGKTANILENVIRDVEIPKKLSVENAIYEAERFINFS